MAKVWRKEHGMKTKLLSTVMLLVALMLGEYSTSWAMSVELQWDANTETDLAGYKVYYKVDSSTVPFDGVGAVEGASPIDVQNQTTTTVSGLDPSHSYTFAVTAYNTSGVESDYSNTVIVPEALAPIISITSPAANSNVSGMVSVSVSASDNVGVTRVEYYVNNVLQATDTSSPYVFSWNTLAVSPGVYTLSARAYDEAGNIGQTGNILVTVVNDVTAPTVAIGSPSTGATISGTVTVTANATDNVGVSRVEFYESGILRAAVNNAPYSYSWDTTAVSNGTYTLYAKAYDNTGNSAQSATVSVTVNNADTTVPTVTINSVTSPTTATSQILSGTASDNVALANVTVQVGTGAPVAASLNETAWSYTVNGLVMGTNNITVKATDSSGNSSTKTTTIVVESIQSTSLTVSDALLALQIAVGTVTMTNDQKSRLDVAPVINGVSVPNGKIDTGDAIVILSNVVGKIAL